jgi:hypothetical protein
MPYAYRFLLARDPDFLRKALAIFHRTLSRHYENKARIHNHKNPKAEAITVVQRFGEALNLNVHFHTIYIDGVFYENHFGDEVFFEFVPTHEEVVQLNGTLRKCLMRLLEKFEQVENNFREDIDWIVSDVNLPPSVVLQEVDRFLTFLEPRGVILTLKLHQDRYLRMLKPVVEAFKKKVFTTVELKYLPSYRQEICLVALR